MGLTFLPIVIEDHSPGPWCKARWLFVPLLGFVMCAVFIQSQLSRVSILARLIRADSHVACRDRPATPEIANDAEAAQTPLPDLLFSKDSAHVPDLHLPHLPSLPDIKLPEIDIQGATLAMGIAKVLEGMRGMFIEVAKDEADVLVGEVLRLENGGEVGLLLEDAEAADVVNQPPVEVSEMNDSKLATADPEELAIPGAFDTQAPLQEDPQSSRVSLEVVGVHINPYAALAISATLSSLVVVLVIVGRHMLLQAREREAQDDDTEAQDADAKLLDEEEVNEKVGLVDPARGNILVDVDVDDEDEKRNEEMRNARDALHLLVEVANAAAPTSSNFPPLGYSSRPITPRPVYAALQNLSMSRPGSPVPRPDPNTATPLRDAVEKLRGAAGTPVPSRKMSLCVPLQHYGPHKDGSDDTDESDEEHSRVWRSANTSPVPPFPGSPSTNGDDNDDEDDEEFVDAPDPELVVIPMHTADYEMKAKRMPLPSAELTYAALELALQLPGTEWIFQFLVIFVSWFGMFLAPPTTSRRR